MSYIVLFEVSHKIIIIVSKAQIYGYGKGTEIFRTLIIRVVVCM